ncbi:MAG: manganese efflux pump, partial [Firmicutes bacterium]|nr:manganese efflux pump [Bacillota bacterium]
MILEAFLLTLAISIDAFASGFAYGAGKIKIPILSILIITAIGSVFFGVSLFFGALIGQVIPSLVAQIVCSAILIGLG